MTVYVSRSTTRLFVLVFAGLGLCALATGCGAFAGGTPVLGDVNGDGVIDQSDLDAMNAALGRSEGDPLFVPEADLNGDGTVGVVDVQMLVQLINQQAG